MPAPLHNEGDVEKVEQLADYWEPANEVRPGGVLHPGDEITNRGNNPLKRGEKIRVWADIHFPSHGMVSVEGEFTVISKDDGDVHVIPSEQGLREFEDLFVIDRLLTKIKHKRVVYHPEYDAENDRIQCDRVVESRGSGYRLVEARRLDEAAEGWL